MKYVNKAFGLPTQIWNFIRLTRAIFLLGGILLYALGAAIAARMGFAINPFSYLVGQVLVTSIQLMAHYLNEYYDVEVDRLGEENRTWFSGGSGVLAGGGVPLSSALTAAHICALVGLLSGILTAILSAWMIPIALLAFIGSWFYSSPPVSLMSSGWGELTTAILSAVLVPLAGYCIQAGSPPLELWLTALVLLPVDVAMLVCFEFPDRASDVLVGKRTLTVRLGSSRTARLVIALILSSFLLLAVLTLFSSYPVRWIWLAAPLAIWQMRNVYRVVPSPSRRGYHLLTACAVALFSGMSLLAFLMN